MRIFPAALVHALAAILVSAVPAAAVTRGRQQPLDSPSVAAVVAAMKPGDYLWAPELAPAGPLLLIVSLEAQRAYLYRNGIPIGVSTISTGRDGYETPTGVFTILQKEVDHKSNLYDDAPMPYMQRLTWSGVALHAGYLPGRPASHGCIRLPMEFAKRLYEETRIGMTVVITRGTAVPRVAPMPSFLTAGADAHIDALSGGLEWHPEKAPRGPVSIVISAADRQLLVLRNGVAIGSAPVAIEGEIRQPVAYVLDPGPGGADVESPSSWKALALDGPAGSAESAEPPPRVHVDESFRRNVAAILAPGSTVVLTLDTLRNGSPGTPLNVVDAETSDRKP